MAVYTEFDAEMTAQIARAFDLGAVREAVPIPQGSINTNYRLETTRGRFFLRHTTVRGDADLSFEAALLEHLHAAHFPAPRLVRTAGNQKFFPIAAGLVSVFDFLSGEERSREGLIADDLEALGREVGKLHRLTLSFGGMRQNPYGPQVVKAWLDELAHHPDPELKSISSELVSELAMFGTLGLILPRGAIHSDIFLDNVKWIGNQVSAIFDFEMACHEAYVLDLAITFNAWCFSGAYSSELGRALIRGYLEERPLSSSEREALLPALKFGAIRYTTSRIRDFHLSPLPPERLVRKDFRTYLARFRALKGMSPGEFRALTGF